MLIVVEPLTSLHTRVLLSVQEWANSPGRTPGEGSFCKIIKYCLSQLNDMMSVIQSSRWSGEMTAVSVEDDAKAPGG